MHTYFDPVIIYGFGEGNRENILDESWLNKNYPEIRIFAMDVVRGLLGEACYGLPCSLDTQSGEIIIKSEDREKVITFYNEFVKLYPKKEVTLGYYKALVGDYNIEYCNVYGFVNEEDEDEDEEEEDDVEEDE